MVWAALGDPVHYIEPFAGTLAVLLNRPHPVNRTYYSETVNDADGLLINFWRSVQWSPDATAEHASWPVTEADKIARSCAVLDAGRRLDMERLMGDPRWHDPELAGWWVWCVCITIGAFGAGGPWWPDTDGRIKKWGRGEERPSVGMWRNVPLLGNNGVGVNHGNLREPGVSRELPHLGDDGRGVNRPQLREPRIVGSDGCHPMTMPELRTWMAALSARLRHVRIINGDWTRAVGGGAAITLPVRQGKGPAGVFLDPPYAGKEDRYIESGGGVAVAAAEWAVGVGGDPKWRIVAAGYTDDDAHEVYEAAGWRAVEWYRKGYLSGGYGGAGRAGADAKHDKAARERLYLSPHCDDPAAGEESQQDGLW